MPNYNTDKGSKGTQPENEKSKTVRPEQGQSRTGLGREKQSEKKPIDKSRADREMRESRE